MSAAPFAVLPAFSKTDETPASPRWAVFRIDPVTRERKARLSPVYQGQAAKLRARAFLDGVLLVHFTLEKLKEGKAAHEPVAMATDTGSG